MNLKNCIQISNNRAVSLVLLKGQLVCCYIRSEIKFEKVQKLSRPPRKPSPRGDNRDASCDRNRISKNSRTKSPTEDPGSERFYTPGLIDLMNLLRNFNSLFDDVDAWIVKVDEHSNFFKSNDIAACHVDFNKLRGPAENGIVVCHRVENFTKNHFFFNTRFAHVNV